MFDMREDVEADPCALAQMMQNLGVFISVKPKVKQTNKVYYLPCSIVHPSLALSPSHTNLYFALLSFPLFT